MAIMTRSKTMKTRSKRDQHIQESSVPEEADTASGALIPSSVVPADHFPKFKQLPAELRLYVWEQAFLEEHFRFEKPFPRGSIQRFRFDLKWDPDRVKPGKDGSRGWVACFTPLSVNTRPWHKFLRCCYESRDYMMRKGEMSMLTVHELQHDGKDMPVGSPRKCHMPFNFGRDIFCVEGITHGLKVADTFTIEYKRSIEGRPRFDPQRGLAEILEVALGLRFAPRVKRLAIIPSPSDWSDWDSNGRLTMFGPSFMVTTCGQQAAALSKRFPCLVSVRSGIPRAGYTRLEKPGLRRSSPGYFEWHVAGLRGYRQGGPTGMSDEERDALYSEAWRKLFVWPFYSLRLGISDELWRGCVCLVRRSRHQLSLVDESGSPLPQPFVEADLIEN